MPDREKNRACVGPAPWALHLLGRKSFFGKCRSTMLITSCTGHLRKKRKGLLLCCSLLLNLYPCACASLYMRGTGMCVFRCMHPCMQKPGGLQSCSIIARCLILVSGSLAEPGSREPLSSSCLPHLQHWSYKPCLAFFVAVYFWRQGFSVS